MPLHAELLRDARELQEHAVSLRRRIHRHPELGLDLPRTKAAVLESLAGLELDVVESRKTSGLVVTLQGAKPGKTVLLRGDMDALPMPEDTGLDFASEVDGRMHACGHDAHTAMLATAVKLLHRRRDELEGQVRFLFQPGEEGHFGARVMLEEGLLDRGPEPDGAFALHVMPNLEAGVIACRSGNLLAAADYLEIEVVGRGGHASMPHDANDPVPVACEMVGAFQTFVTRRIPAFDPVVLTIAQIQAGSASNVIPGGAVLRGTLRSFSDDSRAAALAGIERVATHVARAHGMEAKVDVKAGYPTTVNDADAYAFVRRTASELFGADAFHELRDPIMGAEDFSYVLQRYPGAMAFLGSAPAGCVASESAPCHSNHMRIDEDAMACGVALHAALAFGFLQAG